MLPLLLQKLSLQKSSFLTLGIHSVCKNDVHDKTTVTQNYRGKVSAKTDSKSHYVKRFHVLRFFWSVFSLVPTT